MRDRSYAARYLSEAQAILAALDPAAIDAMAHSLAGVRERGGRLFFLGVGGGAAHASHAVCDFRKIAGFEAYTPADNVAELSARVNDEGWETTFVEYLRGSRLAAEDGVFVFSVGGGSEEPSVSANLVRAVAYAKEVGASVYGVVGRDGGYTAARADHCIIVPTVAPETVTPHTESFQAVLWHLLVTHPALRRHGMKWETLDRAGGALAAER
ncbi:MAG TPA: SIS domain-containing protein [Longimicrobiales bacterium]